MYASNNLYYRLKMFIPRHIQIRLRRMLIQHKINKHKDIWPIDPKSANPPDNWQGWPEAKQFAFVLTHDVETAKGIKNCRALMDLEEKYGFRSSFNFVAGDYPIPQDLIEEMTERGFEIGIHGLHHNGNLFRSQKVFTESKEKINQALKKYSAVGFRSPSMYHNLDWIHELNIEYDASTFDTDPFEPQPDGAGTIFPFWVEGADGKTGYVELPYTLPQDFLTFILLQKKGIHLWQNKLDWIVKQGGMCLFISHPDYINFKNTKLSKDEFPIQYYEDFLRFVKKQYEGQYWPALPRDVAKFWKDNYKQKRPVPNKSRRICMIAYSFYENDNRIMRYADALAQRGDVVDVVALKNENMPKQEILRQVNVYRIQKRTINETVKASYLSKLLIFLFLSSVFVTRRHLERPYDLIHVHSVPDFEVFAALIPKIKGAKVILDIHDIVPEFYASKFTDGKDSFMFKALAKVEQLSIKFSNHVIISNHLWYKTLTNRSVNQSKCTTIMNYPDEAIFFKRPRTRNDDRFIMIYPGTLGWHQGLDIAIMAFAKIKDRIPKAEFHIYGRGPETQNLQNLIKSLNIGDKVFRQASMPITQIADVMSNADLGIIPKRNDPFGGEAFSTKTLEFMSLGIPIIVSGTKIDKYYFNDSVVKFFTPDDVDDLAAAMMEMATNKNLRNTIRDNADKFVENYRWSRKKEEYFNLVDSLISQKNKIS